MRTLRSGVMLAILIAITFVFTGCIKDECKNSYTIFRPIYQPLSLVRNQMKWEPAQNIENPGKIYLYGKYLLLNELGKGVHVFDNSIPANPKKLGFLRIGGNVDMAVRNNVLYADSYADLVAFPIENWASSKPSVIREKVFNDRNHYVGTSANPDSVQVVVGYEQKDTVVDCETIRLWQGCPNCEFADAGGRPILTSYRAAAQVTGTGGSMARFTLVNSYLYTVTTNDLSTFDVSEALNPTKVRQQQIGWGIETIYPFANKLFIGSMTGMFIFDLANPAAPAQQGRFDHARVCDPVIADEQYAFVTLRSGAMNCAGVLNQLDVVNISNVMQPWLVKSYPLTNPHGLSKDGNLLFVCDGKDGLKVFDASDPVNLKLKRTIGGMGETFDVIAQDHIALVVAKEGIFQYDYSNPDAIRLVSKVTIRK